MDGKIIPNVWAQYDLARSKLDKAGYHSKKIMSSESWIVWDNSRNNHDVNKDGKKDERDAFDKSVTIIGKMLERGLNTINLPWSDNSSPWSMGLTKRHDYNGRIKKLNPSIVIPVRGGGPDIVTAKVALGGSDKSLYFHRKIRKEENDFSVKNFIDPSDPNHLHYYVWRWYSQIAGGSDEAIRHAIAGEVGNDINISGLGFTGGEIQDRLLQPYQIKIHCFGIFGWSGRIFFDEGNDSLDHPRWKSLQQCIFFKRLPW